jgi:hypothetical protein
VPLVSTDSGPNQSLDQSRRSGWNQVGELTAATWSARSLRSGSCDRQRHSWERQWLGPSCGRMDQGFTCMLSRASVGQRTACRTLPGWMASAAQGGLVDRHENRSRRHHGSRWPAPGVCGDSVPRARPYVSPGRSDGCRVAPGTDGQESVSPNGTALRNGRRRQFWHVCFTAAPLGLSVGRCSSQPGAARRSQELTSLRAGLAWGRPFGAAESDLDSG